jgi:hypothetical protein
MTAKLLDIMNAKILMLTIGSPMLVCSHRY